MLRFLRHNYGVFDRTRLIGPACWPHHDLFFVHRGKVILTFPDLSCRLTLQRGQGVLIWPGTKFNGLVVSNSARASIQHFSVGSGDAPPLDRCLAQKSGFSAQQVAPFRELERDIDRAVTFGRRGSLVPAILRVSLLTLILVEGGFLDSATVTRTRPRIDQPALLTWLQGQISTNPGVTELARQSGLSASRFRSIFRAEGNITAGEFLRRFRENEARRLLIETQQTQKQIAANLGYADVVAFHRAFTNRVGLTPGHFRQQNLVSG